MGMAALKIDSSFSELGVPAVKTFKYPSFFKVFYFGLYTLAPFYLYLAYSIATESGFFKLSGLLSTEMVMTVASVLLAHFGFRPLISERVTINPNGIEVYRLGTNHSLGFDEISGLSLRFIPNVGGWFRIYLKSGRSFKFTSALEEGHLLVDEIISKRPDLKKDPKVVAYQRTALLVDQSNERLKAHIKSWKWILFKAVIFPCALLFLFQFLAKLILMDLPPQSYISNKTQGYDFILAFGYFFALFLYVVKEAILLIVARGRMVRSSSLVPRDINLEDVLSRRFSLIYFLTVSVFALGLVVRGVW